MRVNQIYLTSEPGSELPPALKERVATFRNAPSVYGHVVYREDTLRELIQERFSEKVLWAYDKLAPFAYKADLGRYCVLHAMGGWYFDISCRLQTPVELPRQVELLAFRDIQRNSGTACSVAVGCMFARQGAVALEIAINKIVENVEKQYYGITPLCPTGPTLFGRALAEYGADRNYVFGDFVELTSSYQRKNRAFVLPDGTILAWAKECGGGDLTALGAAKTDNYNMRWNSRTVYN